MKAQLLCVNAWGCYHWQWKNESCLRSTRYSYTWLDMMGQKGFTAGNVMFSASSCGIKLARHRYNGPEVFADFLRITIFHICGQNSTYLVSFISILHFLLLFLCPSACSKAPQEITLYPNLKSQIPNPKPPGFLWNILMTQSVPGSCTAESGLHRRKKLHFPSGSSGSVWFIPR